VSSASHHRCFSGRAGRPDGGLRFRRGHRLHGADTDHTGNTGHTDRPDPAVRYRGSGGSPGSANLGGIVPGQRLAGQRRLQRRLRRHHHIEPAGAEATASDSTDKWTDKTNGSGDVVVRLYRTSPGQPITITVGAGHVFYDGVTRVAAGARGSSMAAVVRRGGHRQQGDTAMGYPLDVGGVDDYPVKVGSMLLTLVEPARGFEQAYNRLV